MAHSERYTFNVRSIDDEYSLGKGSKKVQFFYLIELGLSGINIVVGHKKSFLTVKINIDQKETTYNIIKASEPENSKVIHKGYMLEIGKDFEELVDNIERCYKDEINIKEEALKNNARLQSNDEIAQKQNLGQQLLDFARTRVTNAQIFKKNGNDISVVVREGNNTKYYLINTDSDNQYFGAGNATGIIYTLERFTKSEANLRDLKQSVKFCGGNVIEEKTEIKDYRSALEYTRRSISPVRSTEELIKIEKCFEIDTENKFCLMFTINQLENLVLCVKNLLESNEAEIDDKLAQMIGIDYKALKILIPDPQERASKILSKKQNLIHSGLDQREIAANIKSNEEGASIVKKIKGNFAEAVNINAHLEASKTRKM